MQHLKKFKQYTPDEKKYGDTTWYFISEDGVDFYDSFPDFKKGTMKVVYSEDFHIVQADTDVSGLMPLDCSIIELTNGRGIPEDVNTPGKYCINPQTKKIKVSGEYEKEQLEKQKSFALSEINNRIVEKEDQSLTDDNHDGLEAEIKNLKILRHNVRKAENSKALTRLMSETQGG